MFSAFHMSLRQTELCSTILKQAVHYLRLSSISMRSSSSKPCRRSMQPKCATVISSWKTWSLTLTSTSRSLTLAWPARSAALKAAGSVTVAKSAAQTFTWRLRSGWSAGTSPPLRTCSRLASSFSCFARAFYHSRRPR